MNTEREKDDDRTDGNDAIPRKGRAIENGVLVCHSCPDRIASVFFIIQVTDERRELREDPLHALPRTTLAPHFLVVHGRGEIQRKSDGAGDAAFVKEESEV